MIKSTVQTRLNGVSGQLINKINKNWLIGLRDTNPAILDMFFQRDIKPWRDFLPWSGEFAGKHITSAWYCWRVTGDRELFDSTERFIAELLTCQDKDGYLGCWPRHVRLTGSGPETPDQPNGTWDSWSHYHLMYGLMLWYVETGKAEYLDCVKRIAGLFTGMFFGEGRPRLVSTGSSEMNLSVYHSFAMLYNLTGESQYLDFALEIEKDFDDSSAGNYMKWALEDMDFYTCPKPRWESMHAIMGFTEMYDATGRKDYLAAAEQIVRSILKTDVHNTGAFSTEEQAVGTPYRDGKIETCCVVAFDALVCEVFLRTMNPELADFLEIAHYNACMGCYSPTGRWSTYNTPMSGEKRANFDSIHFQCRPGSPELNCCSVNAPRGVAQLGQWAVTQTDSTVYIASFEALEATLPGGTVRISGEYPHLAKVTLEFDLNVKRVALRVPSWSHRTIVRRGELVTDVLKKGWYYIDNPGKESVELTLDLSLRVLEGADEKKGLSSVYAGPVLFAADAGDNPELELGNLPAFTPRDVTASPEREGRVGWLMTDGKVTLRDFASAGISGSQYTTWIKTR